MNPSLTAIAALFCFSINTFCIGQTPDISRRWHIELVPTMLSGGEISPNEFYYNTAVGIQLLWTRYLGQRFRVGVGVGYEKTEYETFTPLFIELRGSLKKDQHGGFLVMQGGLSSGKNRRYTYLPRYEFESGALASFGWGYQWPLNNNMHSWFTILLRSQQHVLEYHTTDTKEFKQDLNYLFLQLRAGIAL